ncbi:hypothetical protein [Burkholderia sp. Ac-20353]|uniref:hypothetical protein n=1 Tax=Burkholderia sp. Ac-20353 TaxID=2703894 RepID=UPI00197B3515|nr:hypothetical protein [Burkholderia sp. Ac-20353]MBN3790269.1 hypothetical protein [Burkholderia sp. Ac-20353]
MKGGVFAQCCRANPLQDDVNGFDSTHVHRARCYVALRVALECGSEGKMCGASQGSCPNEATVKRIVTTPPVIPDFFPQRAGANHLIILIIAPANCVRMIAHIRGAACRAEID